ncbi:hypothetical protein BH24CHL6_BH24CHL6_01110 [soil metagenome]
MPQLLVVLLVVALTWLVLRTAPPAIDRHIAALAGLLGGWRGEGWPIGVQEEDRDRPWGWGAPPVEEAAPTPSVSSVRPSVRLRK